MRCLLCTPLFLSQSIDEIGRETFLRRPRVGGQAVMDGVMMRNADAYGIAVRRKDASIVATRLPWVHILSAPALRVPFVQGFPVLLETLYNGIAALNKSAMLAGDEEEALPRWQLWLSTLVACLLAVVLFVLAPHLLSLGMHQLALGGDVEGITFHLWDGLFKIAIFVAYLRIIAFLPEIQDVLRYHGAEHKTIHAYEKTDFVTAHAAAAMSRLHPRCGTTFLLFVISLSILIHTVAVPIILGVWEPGGLWAKHAFTIAVKILLIMPISALSYELIHAAATMRPGAGATLLQAPGLFLQKLTTREPAPAHLEVAVIALYEALDGAEREKVAPAAYSEF